MNKQNNNTITREQKDFLISALTEELLLLRTKAGLTQDRLSNLIGISRQTYYAIETRQRKMSWSTYLSLALVFSVNQETNEFAKRLGALPESLVDALELNNGMPR